MLLCINYATDKGRNFRPWQQLQTQTAYIFGADKIIEYSPKDIPADFYAKNKAILDLPRGAGYWLWKPLIIKDALSKVNDGDYVFYVDSGAFYINYAPPLMEAMQKANTDVACFRFGDWAVEKNWTKRDAFILMDCDSKEYTDTPQYASGFILLKKTPNSVALIDEWLEYMQDPRIVTDMPNQLGKENYEGFKENRHDQTAWSLLTKKKNFKPFRMPSTSGLSLPKDVLDRSTYPQTFCLHRMNLRREGFVSLLPQIIAVMKRIETDKELIPEEFRYGLPQVVKDSLSNLIGLYIEKAMSNTLPAELPPIQEILDSCHELNLPETQSLKEALSKLPTPLKQASDKNVSNITKDYYTVALAKDSSLEEALSKLATRQDLTTSLQ